MATELVGIHEIAALAKVSRAAVGNWRARFADFPTPVASLKAGPVFDLEQVRAWLRKRRVQMTTAISTINLKGGVAKTTSTVAVAQILVAEFGKKVLVVDLDPQTNATVMLIGEEKWKALQERGQTVAQLFADALDPDHPKFDIGESLQRKVGNVTDVKHLDLLPGSLDLIDVQDKLAAMGHGRFYAISPSDLLRRALKPILDEGMYDYVLIDCPPSMGIVTLNGLRISQYYIIPTIPDVLSTYGIPQIVKRVRDFAQHAAIDIEALGIVATKYRAQSRLHDNTLRALRREEDAPLFETVIPENTEIAGAAEYRQHSTLRQKWGYRGQYDVYRALTQEILNRVQVPV